MRWANKVFRVSNCIFQNGLWFISLITNQPKEFHNGLLPKHEQVYVRGYVISKVTSAKSASEISQGLSCVRPWGQGRRAERASFCWCHQEEEQEEARKRRRGWEEEAVSGSVISSHDTLSASCLPHLQPCCTLLSASAWEHLTEIWRHPVDC